MSVRAQTFTFDRFTLDLRQRRLFVSGVAVDLGSRSLAILELLVREPERVFSKEELLALVWPGVVVTPNSVVVAMSSLRKVLTDAGGEDSLIVTIPGRGYKFGGLVTTTGAVGSDQLSDAALAVQHLPRELQQETQARPGRMRWQRGAAAGGLALIAAGGALALFLAAHGKALPQMSVAVLPFTAIGPDHAADYVAVTVPEDLAGDLSDLPGSVVRMHSIADRGDLDALSRLHVRYVVTGSIRAEQSEISIHVLLMDTQSNVELWARDFELPQTASIAKRDFVTRRIANSLANRLVELEAARSLREHPSDGDAFDYVIRAREILDTSDSGRDLARAQDLLQHALLLRPDFPDAMAELGLLLVRKADGRDDPDMVRDLSEARAIIAKALALAPHNLKVLVSRARELRLEGKCDEAIPAGSYALELAPSDLEAHTVLANCFFSENRLELAAQHLDIYLSLDPQSPRAKPRYLLLGHIRLLQNRVEDALPLLWRAIAGDPSPDAANDDLGRQEATQLDLIAAYAMSGDLESARQAYASYTASWPNRSVWRLASYYPKSQAKDPGFLRIRQAWHRAGMPEFLADPEAPVGRDWTCSNGSFSATPVTMDHAATIDTNALQAFLASAAPPLLLDIGNGAAVPKQAHWRDMNLSTQETSEYVVGEARSAGLRQADPIIVMGAGPLGCSAYEALQALHTAGFSHLSWYRGGEESWARAGLPATDRRQD